MDERGIQQWNHPGYLRRYPLDYFRQCAEEWTALRPVDGVRRSGRGGRGVGGRTRAGPAMAGRRSMCIIWRPASTSPERARSCSGAAWPWPRSGGRTICRLDCARDNPVLHDYYERFGFRFVAPVEDARVSRGVSVSTPWGPGLSGTAAQAGSERRFEPMGKNRQGLRARWWWPPGWQEANMADVVRVGRAAPDRRDPDHERGYRLHPGL